MTIFLLSYSWLISPLSDLNTRVSDPLFFADPDPGKNLHGDPDPDPGGIRGRGLGVKGKNDFFFEFFSRFR